jgi:histidinol-phosphate phosphatase family protein
MVMSGMIAHWGFHSPVDADAARPIAFLDRDGVLNVGRQGYVNRPSEVELLPGVADVIAQLKELDFLICVVTNQSAISRGLWDTGQLEVIHQELQQQLLSRNEHAGIDLFLTCPHRYEDACGCRKPSPEMLYLGHQLLRMSGQKEQMYFSSKTHPISNRTVNWWGEKPEPFHPLDLMVGDRRSDMGAGWAYGARLFRVSAHEGIQAASSRLLNENDIGDAFQP